MTSPLLCISITSRQWTVRKGGIKVDGSLTHVSDSKDLAAANTATFAAGSLLMVAGDAALTMDGALKAGGTATITDQ